MTDGQKFGFYLPVWRRVVAAREWFRTNGPKCKGPKLSEVLERQEQEFRSWPEPAGPAALQVLTVAKQSASSRDQSLLTSSPTSYGGVTAKDLRRACTFVATADLASRNNGSAASLRHSRGPQATASSKHLNNTQVNHLMALLRLLIEPDDLKAVTDWLHPDVAQKNGMVDYISKLAPEGLLRTIFRNLTHGESSEWRDGNKQQLVWLLKQVKSRSNEFRKPASYPDGATHERDLELEPF